jgi:hypothetical protein
MGDGSLMIVKPEEEVDGGRRRSAIKDGRPRRRDIAGRRRRGGGHPVDVGAVLELRELVGARREGGNEKESERGKEAGESLFHRKEYDVFWGDLFQKNIF